MSVGVGAAHTVSHRCGWVWVGGCGLAWVGGCGCEESMQCCKVVVRRALPCLALGYVFYVRTVGDTHSLPLCSLHTQTMVCVCVYMCVNTCVCVYVYMCVCMCICVCVCVCVCTYFLDCSLHADFFLSSSLSSPLHDPEGG